MTDPKNTTNDAAELQETLGTYTQWAEAFSPEGLQIALKDQARLRGGQLSDGDLCTRTTPSGFSKETYDVIRTDRNDMDYREWNEETGFHGVSRWPTGPGMQSDGQKRRRKRRQDLDDGF
ncbi:MAG: hypothetical protein ACI9MR_002493 [Myxococcota bacterium]|jgi:hypothetical protein